MIGASTEHMMTASRMRRRVRVMYFGTKRRGFRARRADLSGLTARWLHRTR